MVSVEFPCGILDLDGLNKLFPSWSFDVCNDVNNHVVKSKVSTDQESSIYKGLITSMDQNISTTLSKVQQTFESVATLFKELVKVVFQFPSSFRDTRICSEKKNSTNLNDKGNTKLISDEESKLQSSSNFDNETSHVQRIEKTSRKHVKKKVEDQTKSHEQSQKVIDIYQWINERGFAHKLLYKEFQVQLPNIRRFVSQGLLTEALNLLGML